MKSVVFNSILSLVYRVCNAALSYGLYMVIPILFGVTALGVYALFQALMVVSGIFLTLGLHLWLLKTVAKAGFTHHLKQMYLKVLALSGGLSILVGGSLMLLSPYTLQYFPAFQEVSWALKLMAITLPFQTILMVNVEVLRAMHIIKLSELFRNLATHFLVAIVMVGAYLTALSSSGVPIIASAIGIACTAIASTAVVLSKKAVDDLPQSEVSDALAFKKVFRISIPMMGSALVQNWNSRLMIILLGILTQAEVVAIFGLAFKLSTIPDFFIAAVKAPATPLIAKFFADKSWTTLSDLLQRSVLYTLLLILPLAIIIFSFPNEILALSGKAFEEGGSTLRLLVLAQLGSAFFGLTGTFLNMTKHHNVLLINVSIAMVVNLGLGVVLIPELGTAGAAIGFLVSTLIWNALSAFYIYRVYGIKTFPWQLKLLKIQTR